ncbi:hypothetical protein SAMN05421543_1601, partial [Alicyclobacillus macrosporangiidus]
RFRHDDPSMIGFWGNHLADQGLALGADYLTLTYCRAQGYSFGLL